MLDKDSTFERPVVAESRLIRPPTKRVLVLSSTERLSLARAVKSVLERDSENLIEATIWDRTAPNGWLLGHVVEVIRKFPYVVLVMTADDKVLLRDKEMLCPRDNLVMELGLALATNTPDRTFVVHDADLRLPTDIAGLITYTYIPRTDRDEFEGVRDACGSIIRRVKELNSEMSWPLFFDCIRLLSEDLKPSPHAAKPGFRPQIVVGVNTGGHVAGGLLHYLNRRQSHFLVVWTKNESPYRELAERQEDFQAELRSVIERVKLAEGAPVRILVADDSAKSGEALRKVVELVNETAPGSDVRTASLVYFGPADQRPYYWYHEDFEEFKYAPV